MGRVTVKPRIANDIALLFGPEITRRVAGKAAVMAAAQLRANTVDDRHHAVARADLAPRISIQPVPGWPEATQVVLSVPGRDGEIASHLEFGYVNVRAGRRLAGMHSMRNVAARVKA